MSVVKQKGNMYEFVTHMWGPVKGTCEHDCSYCLPSQTKILMEDFTEKNIDKIKIGDKVIGISKINNKGYNKFVVAIVEDISKRKEETIRIITSDSKIECTLDHPLMGSTAKRNCSDWKKASSFSPYQNLRYVGEKTETTFDINYREKEQKKGWLSGFCDGDGCFFIHKNEYQKMYHGFEAVCVDDELKQKLILIAKEFQIELKEGKKHSSLNGFSKNKYNDMVFSRKSDNVEKLKKIIEFSKSKIYDFYIGYISGMIDSDGSIDKKGKSIRISQSKLKNEIKYNRILFSLEAIGFDYVEEKNCIRLNMNFEKRMKLLLDGKPCHSIKKNRLIFNSSYKGSNHSEIQKIEKRGKQVVFNLQTTCENFIANGFIVHNCYMKGRRFELGDLRINEKDMRNKLGENRVIFVCHTVDLFANNVPKEWIDRVLEHCCKYPKNRYLFQSKNPGRILDFVDKLPSDVFIGTTIETNRTEYYESKAPSYIERAKALGELNKMGFDTMVTIEPIFDFDLDEFVDIIILANPVWVNIGADSKGHDLPEPSKEKVISLINSLKEKTNVELKRNINRILEEIS